MAMTVSQLPDGEELVRFVRTGLEEGDPRRQGLEWAPGGSSLEPRFDMWVFQKEGRRVSAMKRYPESDWEMPRRRTPERGQETPDPSRSRPPRSDNRPDRPSDLDEGSPARRRIPREDEV
jgi:hypothetical protein